MPHPARLKNVPRLLPDIPLPQYSYVTRHFPHPLRDPTGHMWGHIALPADSPDPRRWEESRDHLRALDLFNHGYYWEAHEVWEGLWHATGRAGLLADFLKGLIKLAAAGVKVREGRPSGTARHGRRACELFALTAERLDADAPSDPPTRLLGLSLAALRAVAQQVAENPPQLPPRETVPPVEIVFDFQLLPE